MSEYRDPSWGRATKLALVAIVLAVLWYAVPSSVFIRPTNMAVVKNPDGHWIMLSERATPLGAVTARTQAIIQVLGREDGQDCQWQNDGLFIPKDKNLSRYDITSWAAPCLDAGPPISIRFSRTVKLFNVIPLRPVHYSFTINPEATPVVGE